MSSPRQISPVDACFGRIQAVRRSRGGPDWIERESERLQERRVRFITDQDLDLRRAKQTLGLDVPSGVEQ